MQDGILKVEKSNNIIDGILKVEKSNYINGYS